MKKTLSFEKDLTFQTMIGEVTTISFEEDLKFIDKSNITGNFYISGQYKMTEASTLLEDFSFNIPIEIALLENYDLETAKISILNFTYEIIDDDTLRSKVEVLVEGREEVTIEEKKEVVEQLSESEEEKQSVTLEDKVEVIEEDIREAEVVEEIKDMEERECDGEIKTEEEQELPIKKEQVEGKTLEVEQKTEETKQVVEKQTKEVTEVIESQSDVSIKRDEEEVKASSSIKVNSLFSNLGETSDTFTTYSVYIMREGDNLEKVMDQYKVKKEELEVYNDLSTIELNSKVIIPTSSDE